jgi:hypothetical protein
MAQLLDECFLRNNRIEFASLCILFFIYKSKFNYLSPQFLTEVKGGKKNCLIDG